MPERLTDEQLREIEERHKASTEGVWYWGEGNSTVLCETGIVTATENILVNCGRSAGEPTEDDRDFLVSAHQDIPALLAEIHALKQERDEMAHIAEVLRQSWNRCYHDPKAQVIEETCRLARSTARNEAALEALRLAAESMRTRWELSHDRPDPDGARCDRIRANEASLLQDRIIRHFQLPPTARIEVDDQERPVPPNLLENAS